MRLSGLILVCAVLVSIGVKTTAETRKKSKIYKNLARFFDALARKISQYNCNIFQALQMTEMCVKCDNIKFVSAFSQEKNGRELRENWSKAVYGDKSLCVADKEDVMQIANLSLWFSDSDCESFSRACRALSESLGEKAERIEQSRIKNEKLIYTLSFLGAATLFILFI